ncbi:MAG: bifunctional phosphopantothenoylcysteine decarboxylase/phosphopantothenate--cysteine ligase CoaBC [Bacteroidota bacterium]
MLHGKHILLGVTGGIAAYKTAWLVRELVGRGAEVQPVMTRNAAQFVTPLTLSTLARRETLLEMFPSSSGSWTRHIELGLWADLMLIAPATANTLARIAHGIADDLLSTLVLALRCPLALAPSMDADMYRNAATQQNIADLRESGCFVLDPEEGELASGLSGPGRLPQVERLVEFCSAILAGAHRDLAGRRVLVSAGPTREPIDPVRFIGNRSSGRMGFCVAAAASHRGAEVTLVSGPVSLRTPRGVRRVDVQTAAEMQAALEAEFPQTDLLVMAAAVADFGPASPASSKIKREVGIPVLTLRENPDILRELGARKTRQVMVGFALETENGLENARRKLAAKGADLMVLNNPLEEGAGFDISTNVITIIPASGPEERLGRMSKYDAAQRILDRAAPLLPAFRP